MYVSATKFSTILLEKHFFDYIAFFSFQFCSVIKITATDMIYFTSKVQEEFSAQEKISLNMTSGQVRMLILSKGVETSFILNNLIKQSRPTIILGNFVKQTIPNSYWLLIFRKFWWPFIGHNLKHVHGTYSSDELLIFFWLFQVVICFWKTDLSLHQRNTVRKCLLEINDEIIGLRETLIQVFSCENWEIFENTFFYRTPPVTAFASLNDSLQKQSASALVSQPATSLKKRHWYRCFPVNFSKFLRTPFLTEHLRWVLLSPWKTYFYEVFMLLLNNFIHLGPQFCFYYKSSALQIYLS